MSLTWGDWEPDPSADPLKPETYATPYVDWYEATDYADAGREASGIRILPHIFSEPVFLPTGRAVMGGDHNDEFQKFIATGYPRIPLPADAQPAKKITAPEPRKDVLNQLTTVPGDDCVIVGVIDSGLALAHERFRTQDAKGTRILSAWNQGGVWTGKQLHLPFGQEVMQMDIDSLMAACTTPTGLDEAEFNRRAGQCDFGRPRADRSLDAWATHGTHVMDLAAGCPPDTTDTGLKRVRDRQSIIAVTLPPRASIGPSGSFLELFVMWAIRHIVTTADDIWAARYPNGVKDRLNGYPIVINLSYGLQAGPKDGQMLVQKYLRWLADWREAKGLSPVRIVLPAGNDNLERGVARLGLEADKPQSLTWRIRPEDRTSSYAEIWTEVLVAKPIKPKHSFALSVVTPWGVVASLEAANPGMLRNLIHTGPDGTKTTVARIYCRLSDDALPGEMPRHYRYVYVLCVAPTWRPTAIPAPAGAWTIAVQAARKATALLYVQSDQDPTPSRGTGLLSYFEDGLYRTHDEGGARIDTYGRDRATGIVTGTDSTGPVQRRNSLNAIAGTALCLTVAGYRASDGWPADYSSSARGFTRDDGLPTPTAAAVSDDGAAHFGRLAAGARSGSAAAMQGTSFATAEVTRIVAGAMLDWLDTKKPANPPMLEAELWELAATGDAALNYPEPATRLPLKLGGGRLGRVRHGRADRLTGLTP